MALTDFLCLITVNIIAIPVIDANIPQRQIQFILFCFYVITKERLDIEFIAQNCSINQKTHNNMSINVYPLSHQAGTIWRHACSSHTCFSAKGASLQSCSPSCFCRAIQIGRLLWYILRRWWQSLCPTPSIGRYDRSVSCVPCCYYFGNY